MGVFRKKKRVSEEEFEEELRKAREQSARMKGEAQRARMLREAAEERRKAQVELRRARHPVSTQTVRGAKTGVGRIASAGKEIVITTLTSRRLGPGDRAGTGRKYRKVKRVSRERHRLPVGPTARTLGAGHSDPNLYGFSDYGGDVTPTSGQVDLFGGPSGKDINLVGAKKEQSMLSNGVHKIDLIGKPDKRNLLGNGNKKSLF